MGIAHSRTTVGALGLFALVAAVYGCHHVSKPSDERIDGPDGGADEPVCAEAWHAPTDPVDHSSCSWSGYSGAQAAVWGTSSSNLFAAGNSGTIAGFSGEDLFVAENRTLVRWTCD